MAQPILTLIRHGETEWSRSGQHTGGTDLDLTAHGEEQARQLGSALSRIQFDRVLSSPRRRARGTAELAGLVPFEVDEDLVEWDYGELEGKTSVEIQESYPGWTIWAGPWPGGETPAEVQTRADRVITGILTWATQAETPARTGPDQAGAARAGTSPAGSARAGTARVALVGHGHFSRVLAARWVGQEVDTGAWLDLDTASWSELGWYRKTRVVHHWNVPARGRP